MLDRAHVTKLDVLGIMLRAAARQRHPGQRRIIPSRLLNPWGFRMIQRPPESKDNA